MNVLRMMVGAVALMSMGTVQAENYCTLYIGSSYSEVAGYCIAHGAPSGSCNTDHIKAWPAGGLNTLRNRANQDDVLGWYLKGGEVVRVVEACPVEIEPPANEAQKQHNANVVSQDYTPRPVVVHDNKPTGFGVVSSSTSVAIVDSPGEPDAKWVGWTGTGEYCAYVGWETGISEYGDPVTLIATHPCYTSSGQTCTLDEGGEYHLPLPNGAEYLHLCADSGSADDSATMYLIPGVAD